MKKEEKARFLWEQGLKTRNTSHIIMYKSFDFSMEDLQDKPELIRNEILEYLTLHADKIERIEIETKVDPETFKPSVVLRLHTIISFIDHIIEKIDDTRDNSVLTSN